MAISHKPQSTPIVVSCPGGMARQFRVQVASNETASQWRLVGSFRDGLAAHACASELCRSGIQARIVQCNTLPTAA